MTDTSHSSNPAPSSPAPQPPPAPSSSAPKFLGALVFLVVAGAVAWWMVQNYNARPSTGFDASQRVFIDSENGKPFNYELKLNDTVPVLSPLSGKKTGYPAELCYWTKDGRIKDQPTPVLLNEAAGKPGPTFCPDCGRLVVPHNPPPMTGATPPPTEPEYQAAAAAATTAPSTGPANSSAGNADRGR